MNETEIRWAGPSIRDVPADPLSARLDIHGESIILRSFEETETWVKHVNADQIAAVFTEHIGTSTGLLPRGTLWWRHSTAGTVTAIWKEPRVWPVALQTRALEAAERFMLPMPGLIFICAAGMAPWVYAVKRFPEDPLEPVYCMPAFNMFHNGRSCPGNHDFPTDVRRIPESFFQSHFSMTGQTRNRSESHPEDLYELWKELDGRNEYPLEDLVQQGNVSDIMQIPR